MFFSSCNFYFPTFPSWWFLLFQNKIHLLIFCSQQLMKMQTKVVKPVFLTGMFQG